MSVESPSIAIVGGGLVGSLLAVLLARRGLAPVVYERGPGHDRDDAPAGRTINLALSARGIAALEAAGIFGDIEPLLLPMAGRIVHDVTGETRLLAYGQWPGEQIWSVSRAELNRALYRIARHECGVAYRFEAECTSYDPVTGNATFDAAAGPVTVATELLFAADGAGSVIRRALAAAGAVRASESLLDHGYKELTVPATADGRFALDPGGLHVWPRGGFMLIALPNTDRTFTATLFLPNRGETGFDRISPANARALFAREFPDALELIPDLEAQYRKNPVGRLGTVHCDPWAHGVHGHQAILVGDAAHAIVPFHGQGMNAGFEDCLVLDRLVAAHGDDHAGIASRYEEARIPNARAIAAMALENYVEMRDQVRDADFERRRALGLELERLSAGRFIPRYSMVMFHPEIGFAEAERRGRIQSEIITEATRGAEDDVALALRLIERRL